jgi:hypothetical protein
MVLPLMRTYRQLGILYLVHPTNILDESSELTRPAASLVILSRNFEFAFPQLTFLADTAWRLACMVAIDGVF